MTAEAVIACVVKLRTVETVKLPRDVRLPALAEITISSVPEERVKLPGPLSVLKKVMG